VDGEGMCGEGDVVAGGVRYCRILLPGGMPAECRRCPEGSMGWGVVVGQPLHQGEVD